MDPIDPSEFARACVLYGRRYGIDAHYLLAAAFLRSRIQDGPLGNRFGPYQYTQVQWDRKLERLQIDPLLPLSSSWQVQCLLFAGTAAMSAIKLLSNLDRPPEPEELYLSDILGVEICTVGANSPDVPLEDMFSQEDAAAALSELRALALEDADRINWQAVVDRMAVELQVAYDQTHDLIAKARAAARIFRFSRRIPSVEFLFATDRKPTPTGADLFGYERADSLTFGAVRVNVPKDHKIGHLELPSEFRLFGVTLYREDVDQNRHFFIKSANVVDEDEFARIVRFDPSHTAIVFVHGLNTTFSQAVLRFAQIVWDMQFKATSVLYSWPSHGGILRYLYDRDSAITSRPHFTKLLQVLQRQGAIKKLHILAHSMGNMIVLDALNQAARQFSRRRLAELIFAAPDVSVDAFRNWIATIRPIARGLTLYASSQDKALLASRKASAGPRAGDIFADGPMVLSGLDSIDVSNIGAELFGLNHNIFASNRSLIDDIGRIFVDGKRPVSARSPQIRGMPPNSDPPRYWRYPE
jgi:esterase/lipase superfamily enzyme